MSEKIIQGQPDVIVRTFPRGENPMPSPAAILGKIAVACTLGLLGVAVGKILRESDSNVAEACICGDETAEDSSEA